MKHNFEERKQNRIEYVKDQLAKNETQSESLFNQAQQMASVIPLGQPILVGHHSESRDRNYRGKIDNTFTKSVVAGNKAEYFACRIVTTWYWNGEGTIRLIHILAYTRNLKIPLLISRSTPAAPAILNWQNDPG